MTADIEKTKARKSGSSFILTDLAGECPADPSSPCGIYRDDMRLVRAFTLAQEGASDAAPALVAARESVFYDGNLYQKLTLAPQTDTAALCIRFIPGCDDIFDVRDDRVRALPHDLKPYRGVNVAARKGAHGFSQSAEGAVTQKTYKTGFRTSLPGKWTDGVFRIAAPAAPRTLYLAVGDKSTRLPGTLAHKFDAARRAAAREDARLHDFGPRIAAADPLLNDILAHAQADLSVMITDLPTGPYPYAGLPWFSCPFGRDALITALLLIDHYPGLAKGVLNFQAAHQATAYDKKRQAEPGKIFHEIRFGEASAAGENPFARYYGGVNSTPLFVMLAREYHARTGDDAFIRAIWPNLKSALAWTTSNIAQNNGFVRYHYDPSGLTQQCWKDSANSIFSMQDWQKLARDPVATCEVQAYAYEALKAGKSFAALMGDTQKSAAYASAAHDLRTRFNDKFWMEGQGCYAMALDGDDAQCAVVSSNAGHCLLSGIAPKDRALKTAARLMQDNSFSGYGIRTLAQGLGYDPLSYHRGSVWPHDTAMVAMGLRRLGLDKDAARLCDGLLDVYRHTGKIPELFSGDSRAATKDTGPRPYPAACIIQTWAAAAVISLAQARPGVIATPRPPCP